MRTRHVLAAVAAPALALVLTAGAVAVAAGPSAPLTVTHGGYAVCLAPTDGARYRTTTAPDGTVCTVDRGTGIYFVQHGVTDPVSVTPPALQVPYRGFPATDLGPTTLRVTVGYPAQSTRLYRGDLRFWWSVSA